MPQTNKDSSLPEKMDSELVSKEETGGELTHHQTTSAKNSDSAKRAPSKMDGVKYTRDVFHRGAFHLLQPALKGHRSGVDAMILAASVPDNFTGHLADLGAGAGAAGFAVASRLKKCKVTLIERSDLMADFARLSINDPQNQHLVDRISLIEADVTLMGKARHNAGLQDNSFDYAIMNPPFNEPHDRATPYDLKAQAHVMPEGMFENWLRTASAIVRPGGGISIIARPSSLKDIVDACHKRFGGLRILSVHPRPSAAAIRIIVQGIKGSRAALSIEPPLILHNDNGNEFTDRAHAINNGQRSLFGS